MSIDTNIWMILALLAVASLAMFAAYELNKRNQQLKEGLKGQIAVRSSAAAPSVWGRP